MDNVRPACWSYIVAVLNGVSCPYPYPHPHPHRRHRWFYCYDL